MRLRQHQITSARRTEDMVKRRFQRGGSRGVGGDVAPQAGSFILSTQYHRRRIPTNDVFNPFLDFQIARIRWLFFE